MKKKITNGVTYGAKRDRKKKKKGWDGANSSKDKGTFIFISTSQRNTKPYVATSISPTLLCRKPCISFLSWILLLPSELVALSPT